MARFGIAAASVLVALALAAYTAVPGLRLEDARHHRAVLTAFAVAFAFLARAWLDRAWVRRVRSTHGRYLLHKAVGVLVLAAAAVAVLAIWVEDVRTIGLTAGIVGAGVAVALQKPITSAFGLGVILVNRLFRVGDRIQIGATKGDVVDVRVFYTTVMEIGEWMDAETWTGRIVAIPNYRFMEEEVANYTKDFAYLWDVVAIPVTLKSDWRKAERILVEAVEAHTGHYKEAAREALERMSHDYLVPSYDTEPRTAVQPTDDWIEVRARFVTTPRGRRRVKSAILSSVLERLREADGVEIASERLLLREGRSRAA